MDLNWLNVGGIYTTILGQCTDGFLCLDYVTATEEDVIFSSGC